jgi:hypothetical protein
VFAVEPVRDVDAECVVDSVSVCVAVTVFDALGEKESDGEVVVVIDVVGDALNDGELESEGDTEPDPDAVDVTV